MELPNRWIKDLARHAWKGGKPETVCGTGSLLENTKGVRQALPAWIAKYGIRSLADVGCGDQNWISQVALGCKYRGYDIEPRAEGVISFDITTDGLAQVDAVLCRHTLEHLSEDQVVDALAMFKRAAWFLIASTGHGPWKPPSSVGHFADYDLRLPPFNLGEPLEMIEDCRSQLALWKT